MVNWRRSVDIDCGSWWLLTVWISEVFVLERKQPQYVHMLLAGRLVFYIYIYIHGGVLVDQLKSTGWCTRHRRWKRSTNQQGWWQQAWLQLNGLVTWGVWLGVADLGDLILGVFGFLGIGEVSIQKAKIELVQVNRHRNRDHLRSC